MSIVPNIFERCPGESLTLPKLSQDGAARKPTVFCDERIETTCMNEMDRNLIRSKWVLHKFCIGHWGAKFQEVLASSDTSFLSDLVNCAVQYRAVPRCAKVERAALQNNEHLVKLMMDHYALGFSLRSCEPDISNSTLDENIWEWNVDSFLTSCHKVV